MTKDSKCKCTLAQSLVGDGCRYCQPQYYIDRLRDEIKDMQDDYDKLFNEKATVWNLTADAPSWQGLSDDEINDIKTKAIICANGMSVEQLLGLIVSLTEQALKEKNT
jgi:hypothetical protein